MKTFNYLIFIVAFFTTLSACEKENATLVDNMEEYDANANITTSRNIRHHLAEAMISEINKEGSNFLNVLTKLSNQQFDMDYDVLGVSLLKNISDIQARSSNSSFISGSILTQIEKDYPLLNFYVPFASEDFETAKDYYVVIWPEDGEDGSEYKIPAYNKAGEKKELSSVKEPDVPYIVIGNNERVKISENTVAPKSVSDANIYKTDFYTYTLPDKYNPLYDDPTLSANLTQTRVAGGKRNISDTGMSEIIKSARFSSIDAINKVEGWGKGQPEVAAKAAYYKVSDPILENRIIDLLKNVSNDEGKILEVLSKYSSDLLHGEIRFDMGKKGWFSGSRWSGRKVAKVNGNWKVFRWNEQGLPTLVKYRFYEEDSNPAEPTVEFKGVKLTIKINAGTQDIGECDVLYNDPLGIEYSTAGSNFYFTIDQEKIY